MGSNSKHAKRKTCDIQKFQFSNMTRHTVTVAWLALASCAAMEGGNKQGHPWWGPQAKQIARNFLYKQTGGGDIVPVAKVTSYRTIYNALKALEATSFVGEDGTKHPRQWGLAISNLTRFLDHALVLGTYRWEEYNYARVARDTLRDNGEKLYAFLPAMSRLRVKPEKTSSRLTAEQVVGRRSELTRLECEHEVFLSPTV